tara:strand:+ start:2288 stop:2749 length:462 start_codon:yes stop_codon:yes gene_type:complete
MFANFDDTNFPIINVTLNGSLTEDEEFLDFKNNWLSYYNQKKDFIFIFDLENMISVNPKYVLLIANFIKEIKKAKYTYLKTSVIYVSNQLILELLNFVFNIEKPLNTVYIIQETNNNKETLNNQLNRSEINENINIIKNFIKSENVKHKIIEV